MFRTLTENFRLFSKRFFRFLSIFRPIALWSTYRLTVHPPGCLDSRRICIQCSSRHHPRQDLLPSSSTLSGLLLLKFGRPTCRVRFPRDCCHNYDKNKLIKTASNEDKNCMRVQSDQI